jgi:hypothetical protein
MSMFNMFHTFYPENNDNNICKRKAWKLTARFTPFLSCPLATELGMLVVGYIEQGILDL